MNYPIFQDSSNLKSKEVLSMKAIELKPGQFFDYLGKTCICDSNPNNGQPISFQYRDLGYMYSFAYVGPQCEIRLLPFKTWSEAEGVADESMRAVTDALARRIVRELLANWQIGTFYEGDFFDTEEERIVAAIRSIVKCVECSGLGKKDGDVTHGDGVMAIERDCVYCNGTGLE